MSNDADNLAKLGIKFWKSFHKPKNDRSSLRLVDDLSERKDPLCVLFLLVALDG